MILKCLAGIVIKNENLNNSIDEMQNVINNEIQFYEMTEEEIIEFNGLFAKIILDKNINSELRIMQNGKFLLDKNKLNMDSSEFEKYFDVN